MSKLQILYADDEPDIREVATLSLQIDPEIEVRAVESGAAALSLLDAGEFEPDLILLDVMMPDLDGPGVLQRLRTRPGFGATPVVFITARAQVSDRERLMALGAAGVITKPFDPLSLAAKLRGIVAGA